MNTLRSRIRLAHVGIAAFTAGVVYSPSFDASTVRDLFRFGVLPGLALTGAALWALPTLRRRRIARSRHQDGTRDQTCGRRQPEVVAWEETHGGSGCG